MKFNNIFYDKIGCRNEEEVFYYLINNFKQTIRTWDYFVAWDKIIKRVSKIEVTLNILNYLIGKEQIVDEFKNLVKMYPEIVEIIPVLIALREENIKILDPNEENVFNYKEYSFKKKKSYTDEEIKLIAEFASKVGLLDIFKKKNVKNIVDYVIGIEVGLDTNARKNRSGDVMEAITELFIKKICINQGYRYLSQANAEKIKENFGYEVVVDKSERTFDFAIDTRYKLYLIETNFYGGGGSKLKAVAGEFTNLFNFIKSKTPQHGFIWITDGQGWHTAERPLREAFNKIDYLLNLNMIEKGILEELLKQRL
mgnify:CR=1 FL=1